MSLFEQMDTFANAMRTLWVFVIGAGWTGALVGFAAAPPHCYTNYTVLSDANKYSMNGCGSPFWSLLYFFTFKLLTTILISNVFIAAIIGLLLALFYRLSLKLQAYM